MKVMGILNVTPDSFSDGGNHFTIKDALNQTERMVEQGVDIIDIGGESTRPFSEEVSAQEELSRVIPTITAIRKQFTIPLSIDTYKAEVAQKALAAGADIINDITALSGDPDMVAVARKHSCPVVIMHMQGSPRTMQVAPQYKDVVEEVLQFFRERLAWLAEKGIERSRIIIDPGIGFGKTTAHNLSLLKHLQRFHELGQQVLLGHSRKRFLGEITGRDVVARDLPTSVISALALSQNVDIVRVHNVADTCDAIKTAKAIAEAD